MLVTKTLSKEISGAHKAFRRLQGSNHGVIVGTALERKHRLLLEHEGLLTRVLKGWYFTLTRQDGETERDAWRRSYWTFLSGYLGKRFNRRYCMNPESSLFIHAGLGTFPPQTTAVVDSTGTNLVRLPHDTAVLVYAEPRRVPRSRVMVQNLQVWPLAQALALVPPTFFTSYPKEAELVLKAMDDPQALLHFLGEGERYISAERLAGAFAHVGRHDVAELLLTELSSPLRQLNAINPFLPATQAESTGSLALAT